MFDGLHIYIIVLQMRIANYWFMEVLMEHQDFHFRAPSKIESQLIWESLTRLPRWEGFIFNMGSPSTKYIFSIVTQPVRLALAELGYSENRVHSVLAETLF